MATKLMGIRPPDETRAGIQKEAHKRGLTVNALVNMILHDWLKDNETKQGGPEQ